MCFNEERVRRRRKKTHNHHDNNRKMEEKELAKDSKSNIRIGDVGEEINFDARS